jgi:hypothetical protein
VGGSANRPSEDQGAVRAGEIVHLLRKIVDELQNPSLEEGGNVAANLEASVCEDLNPYMEDPKGLVSAVVELRRRVGRLARRPRYLDQRR